MAQEAKNLSHRHDDLSLIPGTHLKTGNNQPLKVVLSPLWLSFSLFLSLSPFFPTSLSLYVCVCKKKRDRRLYVLNLYFHKKKNTTLYLECMQSPKIGHLKRFYLFVYKTKENIICIKIISLSLSLLFFKLDSHCSVFIYLLPIFPRQTAQGHC